MITINGLSKSICKKTNCEGRCNQINMKLIIPMWFKEIDHIYFSSENDIEINLSDLDKMIINSSEDCKDKFKTLLFKKNIKISSSTYNILL